MLENSSAASCFSAPCAVQVHLPVHRTLLRLANPAALAISTPTKVSRPVPLAAPAITLPRLGLRSAMLAMPAPSPLCLLVAPVVMFAKRARSRLWVKNRAAAVLKEPSAVSPMPRFVLTAPLANTPMKLRQRNAICVMLVVSLWPEARVVIFAPLAAFPSRENLSARNARWVPKCPEPAVSIARRVR